MAFKKLIIMKFGKDIPSNGICVFMFTNWKKISQTKPKITRPEKVCISLKWLFIPKNIGVLLFMSIFGYNRSRSLFKSNTQSKIFKWFYTVKNIWEVDSANRDARGLLRIEMMLEAKQHMERVKGGGSL